MINMISHNKLTFDRKEEIAVKRTVRSGYWAGGNEVKKLEKLITNLTHRKYAINVSSGLSALRLSLLALGVKKKDEVIIPAYSCVAIVNAVLSCGATPVLADVIINNWNLDSVLVQNKISTNTKAIIAINTFGASADFLILNDTGIPVIEDCAHAIGQNNKCFFGKQALISITSFYATKLVGGGEGGSVMTDNKNIANFIRDYRDYTDKEPSGQRLNDKMSDIEASISICQVNRLNSMIKLRKNIAQYYNEKFSILHNKFPEFIIPTFEDRIWYRYVVCCKKVHANILIEKLRSYGIAACQPVENWINKRMSSGFVNAHFAYNHLVSLPIYPTLTNLERENVVRAVEKTLQKIFL